MVRATGPATSPTIPYRRMLTSIDHCTARSVFTAPLIEVMSRELRGEGY